MLALILAIVDEQERNLALDLYEKYRSRIMRLAGKYFRSHQDIEDALSDSVVKMIRNIDKFLPLGSDEREALLVCMTERVCRTKYVKGKDIEAFSVDLHEKQTGRQIEDSVDIEDIIINRDTISRARGLLAEMGPHYAEMVKFRHFGFSFAEIANEFNLTESNVRVSFHRMRTKLNETVGKDVTA